jgi:hypothetical protein
LFPKHPPEHTEPVASDLAFKMTNVGNVYIREPQCWSDSF